MLAHVAIPEAFSGGLQEGSQDKDWEARGTQQAACVAREGHSQGEDQSTLRAGTPRVIKRKREIKVEGSNATNRTWPGNKVVGKDEPLLPSKCYWV